MNSHWKIVLGFIGQILYFGLDLLGKKIAHGQLTDN